MRFWDLIFKRYASPLIFLDNLILTHQLTRFIIELGQIKLDEDIQEYYLFKIWDKSFGEFKDEIMSALNAESNQKSVEEILEDSIKILEGGM